MFAAAILRSYDDRSVDRNYFSGVCNERKILEKFSKNPLYGEKRAKRRGFQDFRFQTLQ